MSYSSFNGQTISYDDSGNPTSYKGDTITWNGRLMTSYTKGNRRYEYSYNSDGMRTVKKIYENNELIYTYLYIWDGDVLLASRISPADSEEPKNVRYLYDESGELYGMDYNGAGFFGFIKNLQGDIVSIVPLDSQSDGEVNIEYDAWGKPIFEDSSLGASFVKAMIMAAVNVGYRGYFYDFETGLYYLRSRYYDPEIGRFINADDTAYLGYDGSPLSMNLFAYCCNDPVSKKDISGHSLTSVLDKVYDAGTELYNKDTGLLGLGFQNKTAKNFREWFSTPWTTSYNNIQSHLGYMDLYDKSAWMMGCYIDCLKSEFPYNNRYWRFEFWMGRYGINIGGEIGVYYRNGNQKKYYYKCAKDNPFEMYFILQASPNRGFFTERKTIMSMGDGRKYWWLTGFLYNSVNSAKYSTKGMAMLALIKMPYVMYKLLVSHFEVVSKTNIYWDFDYGIGCLWLVWSTNKSAVDNFEI